MPEITLETLLKVDFDRVSKVIQDFIRDYIYSTGCKGVVIGLSGGIDSSVTAYLTVKAIGKENVLGLIMPYRTTPKEDIEDALTIANTLGIKYYIIDITGIRDSFAKLLPEFNEEERIPTGNLLPRIRMTILYYYANKYNYIVVGTSDKSELLLGYFTKYGDGGVDILPIGCLYKTQVRALGKYLGIPGRIIAKPSSPRLWPGHLAEEELGFKYEDVDPVLYALFDLKLPIEETVYKTGKSIEFVKKIYEIVQKNEHKRKTPPVPSI